MTKIPPEQAGVARQVAQIGRYTITSNGRTWYVLDGGVEVGRRSSLTAAEGFIKDRQAQDARLRAA